MTTPIPERLAAVRDFLTAEILPSVPGALRGELRAAIKLLADMGDEIDPLPGLLDSEARAMLEACEAGLAALAAPSDAAITALRLRLDHAARTMTQSTAIHDEAAGLMGAIALRLAARVRKDTAQGHNPSPAQTALAHCHQCLAAQAAVRTRWQSVFGPEGLYAIRAISPHNPEQQP